MFIKYHVCKAEEKYANHAVHSGKLNALDLAQCQILSERQAIMLRNSMSIVSSRQGYDEERRLRGFSKGRSRII